ncbi:MAG: hypothetical protein HQK89_05675 [Nitrospirae bacterium]|nr:hypothetical protein [Nitrospirota bacterium]
MTYYDRVESEKRTFGNDCRSHISSASLKALPRRITVKLLSIVRIAGGIHPPALPFQGREPQGKDSVIALSVIPACPAV